MGALLVRPFVVVVVHVVALAYEEDLVEVQVGLVVENHRALEAYSNLDEVHVVAYLQVDPETFGVFVDAVDHS